VLLNFEKDRGDSISIAFLSNTFELVMELGTSGNPE
jgi:hypothetical protein